MNAQLMAKDGNYYVSNLSNSKCRSFTHQKRNGIMDAMKEKGTAIVYFKLFGIIYFI